MFTLKLVNTFQSWLPTCCLCLLQNGNQKL